MKRSVLKPNEENDNVDRSSHLQFSTAIFVGVSAGYLGSLMVLEKMALVGDALSHVALPGLAIGVLFNFDPLVGAFAFLFASAVIIWHIQRVTKISFEALVGAMFTLALAIGILLMGMIWKRLKKPFWRHHPSHRVPYGRRCGDLVVAIFLTKAHL